MKINREHPQIKLFVQEMINEKIPYLPDKFEQEDFMFLVIEQMWNNNNSPQCVSADGNVVGARRTELFKKIFDYKRIYLIDELTNDKQDKNVI